MKRALSFVFSIVIISYIIIMFFLISIFGYAFSPILGKKRSFRLFYKLFIRIGMFLFHQTAKVKGLNNIPPDRKVILLANHASYVDVFLMNGLMQRWLNFIVFARYLMNPVTLMCNRGAGVVVRSSGHRLVGSSIIQTVIESINSGDSFLLFLTEATGPVLKVRPAIYKIIAETDAVILPVHIRFNVELGLSMHPEKGEVVIGRPLDKQQILSGGDEFLMKAISTLAN